MTPEELNGMIDAVECYCDDGGGEPTWFTDSPNAIHQTRESHDDIYDGPVAYCESAEVAKYLVHAARIFPHLVARIRELEAQRPEVEIMLNLGGFDVHYDGIPLHWAKDEAAAREWAIANGFRVKA